MQTNSNSGLIRREGFDLYVGELGAALLTRPISSIENKELYEIFRKAINKAFVLIRYEAPSGSELTLITDETMKLAKSNYGKLREDEVMIAFTKGVMGESNVDFKGLSVVTFTKFIKAHITGLERMAMIAELNKPKAPAIPGYDEMFEVAKNNAIRALIDTEADRDISLYSSSVYVFLERLKLIDLTDEEIKNYQQHARSILANEYQERVDKKKEYDKHDRKVNQTILDVLVNGEKSKDVKAKIVLKAKFLAVSDFMKSALMDETDLVELIESKKGDFNQEELFGLKL